MIALMIVDLLRQFYISGPKLKITQPSARFAEKIISWHQKRDQRVSSELFSRGAFDTENCIYILKETVILSD